MIRINNQAVFDAFLDFPKPILIAANGPAIGNKYRDKMTIMMIMIMMTVTRSLCYLCLHL